MVLINTYDENLAGSLLARRNPTVKFASLFVVSFALMFIFDPITPFIFYIFCIIFLRFFASVSWKFIFIRQLPFIGFALGAFMINIFTRPGNILWQSGWLRITSEGILVGGALFWRTLAIGILVIACLVTTDPSKLLQSLSQHAKLPIGFSYALLSGYQMLQNMPQEWHTIISAHKVRRPINRKKFSLLWLKIFSKSAFSLLVTSLRKAEILSQALESRGTGLEPRTIWKPVALEWRDMWVFIFIMAAFSISVFISYYIGFFRGVAILFS